MRILAYCIFAATSGVFAAAIFLQFNYSDELRRFQTIEELLNAGQRTSAWCKVPEAAITFSRAKPGDGGGGSFYAAEDPSLVCDDGTVFLDKNGRTRWVRIFSGPLNVKWFGAAGDGKTDDTDAIQRAITTGKKAIAGMASEINGRSVYFPEGIYRITKTLDLSENSGVSLMGTGKTKSTIMKGWKEDAPLLDFSNSDNYRGEINGLRLTGGHGGNRGALIFARKVLNQLDVKECWLDSIDRALEVEGMSDCFISDNVWELARTFLIAKGSVDLTIRGNIFSGYGPKGEGYQPSSFYFEKCSRMLFQQNRISWGGAVAAQQATMEFRESREASIEGNIFSDFSPGFQSSIIKIRDRSRNIRVAGNFLGRSLLHSISIEGKEVESIQIESNQITGTTNENYSAIHVSRARNIMIKNNMEQSAPRGNELKTRYGIEASQVDNLLINSNMFTQKNNIIPPTRAADRPPL